VGTGPAGRQSGSLSWLAISRPQREAVLGRLPDRREIPIRLEFVRGFDGSAGCCTLPTSYAVARRLPQEFGGVPDGKRRHSRVREMRSGRSGSSGPAPAPRRRKLRGSSRLAICCASGQTVGPLGAGEHHVPGAAQRDTARRNSNPMARFGGGVQGMRGVILGAAPAAFFGREREEQRGNAGASGGNAAPRARQFDQYGAAGGVVDGAVVDGIAVDGRADSQVVPMPR